MSSKLSNAPKNREELARGILNRLGIKGMDDKEIEVTTNEDIVDFLMRTGGFVITDKADIIRNAKYPRIIEIREEGKWVNNIFHGELTDEEFESLGIDFNVIADKVQERFQLKSSRIQLKKRLAGSDEAAPTA